MQDQNAVDSKEIRMSARELELYQAGQAIGAAQGIEAAAELLERVVKQIGSYEGGPALSRWLAALERDLADATQKVPPAVRKKTAFLVAQVHGAVGNPLEAQAGIVKAVADSVAAVRAAAAPHRAKYADKLMRASLLPAPADAKPIPFVQRVARRALEKLAKIEGG